LKPGKLFLSITFSIALLFTIYNNSSCAQTSKITSPVEGQQIPVDIKNVPILGVSSYNSGLNCRVSLIVNDVKPYQKASGNTSEEDYSPWNYVLTGHYTSIKQGINKLTAKLSCYGNSMDLTMPTAWNGVSNVAIPPGNDSPVGKVTIPAQPGLNKTVGREQPYNPSNTPFVLAPPSSPAPLGLANNQSLQPPPIANPGPNQVVSAGSPVILNGSGSRSPGGVILSYSWRQIPTNTVITLSGVSTPMWEFTAPKVSGDTLFRFQLNVTDNLGQTATSTVNILDQPGTFHAPNTLIVKSPFVTEMTKSPFVTKSPSITMRSPNFAVPPINPTIPPPLIPSINTRISPQEYQGAGQ
jgi:hypothetical protein